MSANLRRYLSWQARDFVIERGLSILIVSALIVIQIVLVVRARSQAFSIGFDPKVARQLFVDAGDLLCFIATLIATSGMVNNDRKNGWFRFLFSKPVVVPAYYAQSFVVNGVGMVVCLTIVAFAYGLLLAPVLSLGTIAWFALYYLAAGGISFFLSAATRWDWLSLSAVWFGAKGIHASLPPSESALGRVLELILPPSFLSGDLGAHFVAGTQHSWNSIAWLGGYGLVAFVAGLVVLRHRQLGR